MKKILTILLLSLFLVSCTDSDMEALRTYEEMISILEDAGEYVSSSDYYSLSINFSRTAQEKRYYIVVDNPQVAMYDVKIIAFEEGTVDSEEACPNVGIFDEEFNLVPNQINKENGFVKGISVSGVYENDDPTILCLVQWINEDNTKVFREYFWLGSGAPEEKSAPDTSEGTVEEIDNTYVNDEETVETEEDVQEDNNEVSTYE